MRELLNVTTLAKELGISRVRVYQFIKEGRLKADFKINGKSSWKRSTVESFKKALQNLGTKGRPKLLSQKEGRKKNQTAINQEQEDSNVTETELMNKVDSNAASLTEEEIQGEGERESNMTQKVKVYEEPKKFRWQCLGCGHVNKRDAQKDDGSVKKELKCWACNSTVKFSQERNVWYQSEE